MSQKQRTGVTFKQYTLKNIDEILQLQELTEDQRFELEVVAQVFPFKTNQYVVDELIDWRNIPQDPIYQLTFPQRGMLSEQEYTRIAEILRGGNASGEELAKAVNEIRYNLNPHPAGQMEMNVPVLDGERIEGVQHKYDETALFFPQAGQTCHAYCTFCFRWAQFVGIDELRFAAPNMDRFVRYLKQHPEITDVLITGGDPMVMNAKMLRKVIEPLLDPALEHLQNIRIGTKSLAYWPHKYLDDRDAPEVLETLAAVVMAGKHLAIMAHFNHHRELDPPIVAEAAQRLQDIGAVIRTQSPLIRHINDDPKVWQEMWKRQVHLGMVPYYMFVERDTGARDYFAVPLAEAYEIYRESIRNVSGLARTARGPSMSATPGKVEIQGIAEVGNEKFFVLRMIQARNSDWVQRPFFARFDPEATWLNHLVPAFGESEQFFDSQLKVGERAGISGAIRM